MKKVHENVFNENKKINLDSIVVNRDPSSDNELSTKNYIENELDKNTMSRFNQILGRYLEVSVGNDAFSLAEYDKRHLKDVTEVGSPNKCDSFFIRMENQKFKQKQRCESW